MILRSQRKSSRRGAEDAEGHSEELYCIYVISSLFFTINYLVQAVINNSYYPIVNASKNIQVWGINLFDRLAVMYLLAFIAYNCVI